MTRHQLAAIDPRHFSCRVRLSIGNVPLCTEAASVCRKPREEAVPRHFHLTIGDQWVGSLAAAHSRLQSRLMSFCEIERRKIRSER
jgi:hypothetical protein